ncbi:MAG: hypothetical protein V1668_03340 [Patescibacteria group bacterium]
MQGIERAYLDVCIGAVIGANRTLMEVTTTEALNKTLYGKGDTLGLDASPEIIINKRLRDYDQHAILVTEELDEQARVRWPTDANPERQPLMFFSDPTDRSKMLKMFFEIIGKDQLAMPIGELMKRQDCITLWEDNFEKPATITGATTSITCVRKGSIIFSVILNYITQTIYVATPDGVFFMKLPEYTDSGLDLIDLGYIHAHGQILIFPTTRQTCLKPDDCKQFVTFLGKTGYRDNFRDSMVFVEEPDRFLHHSEPGGPARILYLSDLQRGYGPIGFIMANGEKIGEWIHWLAFAKFVENHDGGAKLLVYEISIERPWVKDRVLMSTPEPYSIFHTEDGVSYIDISQLRNFPRPNRFRSMLVVVPDDNERIIQRMQLFKYREVTAHL